MGWDGMDGIDGMYRMDGWIDRRTDGYGSVQISKTIDHRSSSRNLRKAISEPHILIVPASRRTCSLVRHLSLGSSMVRASP